MGFLFNEKSKRTNDQQPSEQTREYPLKENTDYAERSISDERTTETDAAPSPGHKK